MICGKCEAGQGSLELEKPSAADPGGWVCMLCGNRSNFKKKCAGPCHETKNIDEFYRNQNKKDGKADACKKCIVKAVAESQQRAKKKKLADAGSPDPITEKIVAAEDIIEVIAQRKQEGAPAKKVDAAPIPETVAEKAVKRENRNRVARITMTFFPDDMDLYNTIAAVAKENRQPVGSAALCLVEKALKANG